MDILLMDDDAGDVELTRIALACCGRTNRLHVTPDGEAGLEFLRRVREPTDRPDLILLDLNMPRMDGRAVLTQLRQDPALASIPVVVLSTSSRSRDVREAYGLCANAFVTKPTDFEAFAATIRSICEFWCGTARLPSRSRGSTP